MMMLWTVSFALFAVYVAAIVWQFGVPDSISESFYRLEGRKRNLGCLFTLWCWAVAFTVAAMMFPLSEGQWWQFLGLFAGGGLGFTGTAPLFKSHEKAIHYVSAGVCAVSALAWMILAGYAFVPVIVLSGMFILGFQHARQWLFGMETGLFISMYIVLLIKLLNH
jgi:hypothetical protein